MRRFAWVLLFSFPLVSLAGPVEFGALAPGTEWETPWYRIESGNPGPVFVLVGGIHGNEPAGAIAAEQIRHWPIQKGTLVVVPEANRLALAAKERRLPGLIEDAGDLNRHFPRTGETEQTMSPLAEALWGFVKKQEPDWVVDLHEGFAVHRKNSDSVGSSLLCDPDEATRPLFERAFAAVNDSISNPENHFVLKSDSRTANGSLVRASMDRLGATGAILETTYKGFPLGLRVRQHRLMVAELLGGLGMIGNGPDDLVFPGADDDRIAVAIYYGPGAFGNGPLALRSTLREDERFVVRIVGADEIGNGALEQFDAVIFPGGSGSGQAEGIGEAGRKAVQKFVREGGGYVGICGGCYLACENFSWSLGLLDARTKSSKWKRGRAELELEFSGAAQELVGDLERHETVLYVNGPVMAPAESSEIPDFEVLATFRTETAENGSPKGIQVGSPAILTGTFGKGRVVGISPHPEQTDGLRHVVTELIAWSVAGDSTGLSR